MKKFIKIFFTLGIVFLSLMGKAFGQIGPATESLITGTYAKGSSIAVPVSVSGCFKPDNKFEV